MKPLILLLLHTLVSLLLCFATLSHGSDQIDNDQDFDAWLNRMNSTSSSSQLQQHDDDDDNDFDSRTSNKTQPHGRSLASAGTAVTIVVAKDGSGQHTTVQAAVDSVPKKNKQRVIIRIRKGIYREKVVVKKAFITFQGDGASLTYIEWNDIAKNKGPDGKPLSTYGSASVAIEADYFIAKDISFRNFAPPPPGGAVGRQGVALRISGDMAAFYKVSFFGAQDTLYDHKGRHYFYRCYIEGSIDFIFGNGRSFYKLCHLHSIATPHGSLTAQKRLNPDENTGFSFFQCVVTGSGNIFLGRAWGPYSRVVYSYTYFDDIIRPEGWMDWDDSSRQKTVFYGEFKCYGPGANTQGRVKWSKVLTRAQIQPFITTGFINGEQWLE